MIPLPQRIIEILFSSRGVTLAKTHDNYYIVGLDYLPGHLVVRWEPTTDYFASANLDEARRAFFERTGQITTATPPKGM